MEGTGSWQIVSVEREAVESRRAAEMENGNSKMEGEKRNSKIENRKRKFGNRSSAFVCQPPSAAQSGSEEGGVYPGGVFVRVAAKGHTDLRVTKSEEESITCDEKNGVTVSLFTDVLRERAQRVRRV